MAFVFLFGILICMYAKRLSFPCYYKCQEMPIVFLLDIKRLHSQNFCGAYVPASIVLRVTLVVATSCIIRVLVFVFEEHMARFVILEHTFRAYFSTLLV
jgi:hypothetical protein